MNFKTGMLAVSVMALVGVFAAGCGSKCSDLQDICDTCDNDITKAACQAVVDLDDSDTCEAGISPYDSICPAAAAQ